MNKNHPYWKNLPKKLEGDPLELDKYVDLILKELDNLNSQKPKYTRLSFRKKYFKRENVEIELRDIPFVF